MKTCKQCASEIPLKAKKCPQCQSDLRSWFRRNPIKTFFIGLIVFVSVVVTFTSDNSDDHDLSRCINVPREIVDVIENGLVAGSVTLHETWAVKSYDYEKMYFISTQIKGAGIDEDEIYSATFATPELGTEGFLGVGGFAHEFFDWGHGETTRLPYLSISDDGHRLSKECVEAAVKGRLDASEETREN